MNNLRKAAEMALEYMNEYYPSYAKQAAHHQRCMTKNGGEEHGI